MREPVAIIGMARRFPQAASCEAFWELLKQGKDAVTEIQDTRRWSAAAWYDPDPQAANKTHQRHAAMPEGIDDFDPLVFGISPAESAEMNPSQKLMLELVWEAMESTYTTPTVTGRLFPNCVNREELRYATLRGDELTLSTPPVPVAGGKIMFTITWKKVRQ